MATNRRVINLLKHEWDGEGPKSQNTPSQEVALLRMPVIQLVKLIGVDLGCGYLDDVSKLESAYPPCFLSLGMEGYLEHPTDNRLRFSCAWEQGVQFHRQASFYKTSGVSPGAYLDPFVLEQRHTRRHWTVGRNCCIRVLLNRSESCGHD